MTFDQARAIIASVRGAQTQPMAAWTTPTWNRPETHASLYGMFKSQTYENLRLYVYDESNEPSPFFSQLQDPDVVYVHEPMTYKRDVTRIGAARNKLCELARRDGVAFVIHADDDDSYQPAFSSEVIARLGDADVAKLAVFRLLVTEGEAAGTLWLWDVRTMGGTHYGLKGGETPQKAEIEPGEDPQYAEAARLGYGWSYAFRISLWERFHFPEEGTEDYPWMRECLANGAKLVEIDDLAHMCVHTVGSSKSMHWPQVALSPGFAGAPYGMRDFVRTRMLGALPAMYEMPKKDFFAEPGVTYSVLAKVKTDHTLQSIVVRAESWGLTISGARDEVDSAEFGVDKAPDGYRYIHVMGTCTTRTKVPWKTNRLIAMFDKSCIEKAYQDVPLDEPAQVNVQLTPSAPAPAGVGRFLGRPATL